MPFAGNSKMSTGDLPSCLCKRGSKCHKFSPPNIGTGILQDKSVEALWNVDSLVRRYIEGNPHRTFVMRLLMKPTVVVGKNSLVKALLTEKNDCMYNMLKDFFLGLFGNGIIFAEHDVAAEYKRLLLPLFSAEAFKNHEGMLDETIDFMFERRLGDGKMEMYEEFKRLSLAYNLRMFLDIDERRTPELFERISALTTTHWHGIISVPLNVKMPLIMSSGYRRAAEAKESLLQIIEEKMARADVEFINQLSESGMDRELVKNHILLFMCALVPKASASVLTNLLECSHLWYDRHVSDDGDIDDAALETLLLEVVRLWPPFVGGLKAVTREIELGDFHVPKGYCVFYTSSMAHRDPEVFPKAEEFLPERWATFNKDDRDKLYAFGAGLHSCVGEKLIWKYFMHVARRFTKEYTWDAEQFAGREKKMKYVPISRPVDQEPVAISPRT